MSSLSNSLLAQFITSLSDAERDNARLWLQSPVHNRREDLRQLFERLAPASPGCYPDKEALFEAIYPGQSFDDQRFRLLCSYLLEQLEAWLNWRWQQKDAEWQGSLNLLAAYRERGLSRHYEKRLRRRRLLMNQRSEHSPDYYLDLYTLEREAYLWASQSPRARERPHNLQEQDNALTLAIVALKLRHACLAVAHQRVFATQYEVGLLNEILAYCQGKDWQQEPAIAVYYHSLLMLANPNDDEAFRQYEVLFLQHSVSFPPAEQRDLLLNGLNFCIRRINQGNETYLSEALRLYKTGLGNALLLENGWLSPYTYNNAVGIAMRLGEMAWAKTFVEEYRLQLNPAHRTTLYALNLARLAYAERQYGEALAHLHNADYKDFIHAMTARIIQMKIYFETAELDLLTVHLRNMRAFLRRRQIGYHENNYLNIIQLTEALMRANRYDRAEQARIGSLIAAAEPLTERQWLLKMLQP